EKPKNEWNGILDVFEDVLAHEEKVTSLINNLVDVAMEESDHATVNMLQWFVAEQVEEEAGVSEMLDQLKLIEGKGSGLFILDREAKLRVFTPPPGA
nr:ferritin [Bacteroidota bacterium]